MNKLLVIKYEGKRFESGSLTNQINSFKRDCGIENCEIFDQPSKKELEEKIFELDVNSTDNVVIHFISHGFKSGIAHLHPEIADCGDEKTLIKWDGLIVMINGVAEKSKNTYLNLGTVCNSDNIFNSKTERHFTTLVTTKKVTDPIRPRRLNRILIDNYQNYTFPSPYRVLPPEA